MTLDEKFDQILANQTIIIQMLTDIMERKKPDMSTLLKPLMSNPLFKNNPAVKDMLESFSKMGGSQ
jgi:hypothetical protein